MLNSLCLILVTSVLAADNDDAVKSEMKALAGGWTAVSAERDGEAILPEEARKIRLYFGEQRLTLKQGEKGKELLYTLWPEHNEGEINLVATEGPYRMKALKGIYQRDGDTLKFCFPFRPDAPRPTEFSTSAESKLLLLVLKRDKG